MVAPSHCAILLDSGKLRQPYGWEGILSDAEAISPLVMLESDYRVCVAQNGNRTGEGTALSWSELPDGGDRGGIRTSREGRSCHCT